MSTNIMIVDDEKDIADLVQIYLENDGFNVFKFYNAKDALECAMHENLDLAILDVMLPDIDGFSLCKQIRKERSVLMIIYANHSTHLNSPSELKHSFAVIHVITKLMPKTLLPMNTTYEV